MKNADSNSPGFGKNAPKDIVVRTFDFAVSIIHLCVQLDARPGVGRILMSQILRAGTSVPANVEEAQAGQSKADFISKMSIALKEARETHLRLRLLEGGSSQRFESTDSGSRRNQTRARSNYCLH